LVRRSFVLFRHYAAVATPKFKTRCEIWTGAVSLAGNRDRALVRIGLELLPSRYALGCI
jgi:hypothetical protein